METTRIETINIDGNPISYLSKKSASPAYRLHLAPANGFPIGVYKKFVDSFSVPIEASGFDARGAWPNQGAPSRNFDTTQFAQDLLCGLSAIASKPVIGIGHSHGGAVLLKAASMSPELFSALILIDPATPPNNIYRFFTRNAPQALVHKLIPFIGGTHSRQRYWNSAEQFHNRYKTHPTFRKFDDQVFDDYVKFGLKCSNSSQLELSYNPEWESHVFRTVEYLWDLLRVCQHPVHFIRAESSYLYSQASFEKRNKKLASNIQTSVLNDSGHLAPLEQPQKTAAYIESILTSP